MKVCFLNFVGIPTRTEAAKSNLIGGLNTILSNLCESLVKLEGVSVDCIFRQEDIHLKSEQTNYNLIGIKTGLEKSVLREEIIKSLELSSDKVSEILYRNKSDIIHTAGLEAGLVMLKLKQSGLDIPWVHTNFATLSVRKVILDGANQSVAEYDHISKQEKACLQECDHIIALSNDDKSEIKLVFKVKEEKISVVYPGINKNIFFSINENEKRLNIISAGRMSQIKDFPFLLRSFKIFRDIYRGTEQLNIIGGNYLERKSLGLNELIKKLDLKGFVNLYDGLSQEKLANFFRVSKVFVGCSKHETFGLLPVEAMACGLPAIVRNISGYKETAISKSFIVKDELEMANKIYEILNLSDENYKKLCIKSMNSSFKYSCEKSAEQHVDIYRKIILSKRAG